MWYNAHNKGCNDEACKGQQEDVKVFIDKHGGNGIKFRKLSISPQNNDFFNFILVNCMG